MALGYSNYFDLVVHCDMLLDSNIIILAVRAERERWT